MRDEVPIYVILVFVGGILFFGALALYEYSVNIEPASWQSDDNFTYAPHFVQFTVYPPSPGTEIIISSETTGSETAYTDNNSHVVFKMFSSIKYNVTIPRCHRAVVQIYPTFDDYWVEC